MNTRILTHVGLLLLLVTLTITACKSPEGGKDERQQIGATESDSAFDTELNQMVIAGPNDNKFYLMEMEKPVIDTLLANNKFGYIYFAMENDNPLKPRKTTLVAYAMDTLGSYLQRDANGQPVPLAFKVSTKAPKLLKKAERFVWGQYYFSRRALDAQIKTILGNWTAMQFTPQMKSPITYMVSPLNDGTETGSTCTLQPSPPAQPGEGECR